MVINYYYCKNNCNHSVGCLCFISGTLLTADSLYYHKIYAYFYMLYVMFKIVYPSKEFGKKNCKRKLFVSGVSCTS